MRFVGLLAAILALALTAVPPSASAADVICYNCPPQWADWASMLKAIKTDLGLDIPHDNKNSGQALSQLLAEKNNPIADVGYFGVTFGIFRELGKNDAIVPKQTSYARVVSGEIPILFDYDFNAYRAKYNEKGNFEFVLPCEGSVVFPYVIGLVKGAPHKRPAEKVLDYISSDKGQAIWTNAYLRPARPIPLPAAVKARFLPDSDYARAKTVDWGDMATYEKAFADRYLTEVR